MPLRTRKWDVTEFLDSEERIALFLEAAFEENDPSLITAALGAAARARGMTKMANDTGLSRKALCQALSKEGHPEFGTIVKVMQAFGLRLSPVPIDKR